MSSSTPSMINLDARVDSFNAILKPKSKIKPAFPLSPSRFPHLTPSNLANAGFFHSPGSDEESFDTCTCFLCGLKLGGWDEEDDPFEEHMKRGHCAWAEFVCGAMVHKKRGTDWTWKTIESLPSSEESISFRGTTYMKAWPHKARAGWGPTVEKLCEAGFIYTPSSGSTDAVLCPFCDYSVEGWEADDDPMTIHQKKSPRCPFFVAEVEGGSASQAKPATKGRRKTTKRVTRAVESQQEDRPIEEDDASQQPEASTSQAKPRKRVPAKGRGKTAVSTAETDDAAASVVEDSAAEEPVGPKRSTRTRGKGKNKEDDMESVADTAMESVVEEPEPESEQRFTSERSKKGTRKTAGRKTITQKSRSQPAPAESEVDEEVPIRATASQPSKSTSTRARRQTQKAASAPSELQVENEVEVLDVPADGEKEAPKSKSKSKSIRSTSKKSKEIKNTENHVDDAAPSEVEMAIDKEKTSDAEMPKRVKRAERKTKASKAVVEPVEEVETDTNEAVDTDAAKSKSSRTKERRETVKPKSSKSKKTKSAADAEVEKDTDIAVEDADVDMPQAQSQASRPTSQATSRSTSSKSSKSSTKSSAVVEKVVKKNSKPSSRSEVERASEVQVEVEEPATMSKSKSSSSRSGKKSPVESQPAALTQLERFANIPPSSPFPNSAPAASGGQDENADTTPRARSQATSKPARASPHASLSRDQLDKSVAQGAVQARTVMDDILLNFVVEDMEKNLRIPMTEDQKSMTLEQLVRLEFEKRRRVMQKQGEEMIENWEERTRQERRRIEML